MYGPAHNLDRGTCPGTNGSTLTVKNSHISHSNTQPHVATDIFCTCFSCGLVCHNGHYKIPDIHIAIWHCTVIVMRLFLHGIWKHSISHIHFLLISHLKVKECAEALATLHMKCALRG